MPNEPSKNCQRPLKGGELSPNLVALVLTTTYLLSAQVNVVIINTHACHKRKTPIQQNDSTKIIRKKRVQLPTYRSRTDVYSVTRRLDFIKILMILVGHECRYGS